jgi:hypothetical protein
VRMTLLVTANLMAAQRLGTEGRATVGRRVVKRNTTGRRPGKHASAPERDQLRQLASSACGFVPNSSHSEVLVVEHVEQPTPH